MNESIEKLKNGETVKGYRLYFGKVESGNLNNGHVIFIQSITKNIYHHENKLRDKIRINTNYKTGQVEYIHENFTESNLKCTCSIEYIHNHVSTFDLRLDDNTIILVKSNKNTTFLHNITEDERKDIMLNYEKINNRCISNTSYNNPHHFILDRGDKVYILIKNDICIAISKDLNKIKTEISTKLLTLFDIIILFLAFIFFPITLIYCIYFALTSPKKKVI